jgi:hypothetical protein
MIIVLWVCAESSSVIRPSGMYSCKFSVIDGSSNTIYCSRCHLNGLRTPFWATGSFWYPRIIAGSKRSPSPVLMRNGGSLSRGWYFCWGSGWSVSRGPVWSSCCFSTPFPLSIWLLVVSTARPSVSTKYWRPICESTVITSRMIGRNYYHWWSSPSTIPSRQPPVSVPSMPITASTHAPTGQPTSNHVTSDPTSTHTGFRRFTNKPRSD